MFALNDQLEKDTYFITDLKMSRLLLMNDSNFSWFILVPRISAAIEVIDVDFDQQIEILNEINLIGKFLKENLLADKLNIATLGNVVNQLHIHVIGRFKNDIAFPKPVWGACPAKPYSNEDAMNLISRVKSFLSIV